MKMILVCITLVVVIVGGSCWLAIIDARNWDDYAAVHHCHPVGRKVGNVTTAVASGYNGQVTVTPVVEPNQTIYSCDAGEIEIR